MGFDLIVACGLCVTAFRKEEEEEEHRNRTMRASEISQQLDSMKLNPERNRLDLESSADNFGIFHVNNV